LKQGGSRSGISKILSNKLERKHATRRPVMVSSISWAEFVKHCMSGIVMSSRDPKLVSAKLNVNLKLQFLESYRMKVKQKGRRWWS
jgi:hypothetical protein